MLVDHLRRCPVKNREIIRFADHVRKSVPSDPSVRNVLISIAKLNHVHVGYKDLGLDTAGYLEWQDFEVRYAIILNSRDDYHQQTFTLAHELGHFLLGHHKVAKLHKSRIAQLFRERIEVEANIFASEIYVPDNRLSQVIFGYIDFERGLLVGDGVALRELIRSKFNVGDIMATMRIKRFCREHHLEDATWQDG